MLADILLFLILRILVTGGVEKSLQILNTGVESAPETSCTSNTTGISVYRVVFNEISRLHGVK